MKLLKFLKRIFGADKQKLAAPKAEMTALPITSNPTVSAVTLRHVGRLVNLYRAKSTPEIESEIRQRKGALMLSGYDAPNDVDEAIALLKELGG